ncbi:FecR family protein [Parapedobacter sp. SGR-10]|uniref:FecR family protein n=1 Tax=Parapedobacter sp. SGR-10 TaxID=2710879 RepID=UPI0013CF5973|nr:FecR domain-containing protein [Parapedobacter sp. SGR-10]NGF57303.1 FecR family protein [Parapedobacter sp. SGR-10]
MEKQEIIRLLHRLQDKTITPEEFQLLKKYLDRDDIGDILFEDFQPDHGDGSVSEQQYENLFHQIQDDPRITQLRKIRKYQYFRKIAVVAASVLLICGVIYWSYQYSTLSSVPSYTAEENIPLPGGNKAQILLADGNILDLETLKSDTLIQLDGYAIYKGADGQVTYHLDGRSDEKRVAYNTIVTPKGGEYKLLLSDGTYITVNAMSSLRYPIQFSGDRREVELLSGEAYFAVNKVSHQGTKLPFVVKTKEQILTVLGTEFNINTYSSGIVTTLVEGSVQLENKQHRVRLKPTDQAVYDTQHEQYDIYTVDPYYLTAWKDGKFAYEKASIAQVMADISRWYDVDIEYASSVQGTYFSGTISRFENIDKLLNTISLTGSIKFNREGRRVIVMK